MSFIALLDANVLWPAALRCTFVRAAIKGLYRPAWTERILHEMALAIPEQQVTRYVKPSPPMQCRSDEMPKARRVSRE